MTLQQLAHELPALRDEAKMLWGDIDEYYTTGCDCDGAGIRVHPLQDIHSMDCAKVKSNRGYIYHLQQMLVSPDPVKYLRDNTPKGEK